MDLRLTWLSIIHRIGASFSVYLSTELLAEKEPPTSHREKKEDWKEIKKKEERERTGLSLLLK